MFPNKGCRKWGEGGTFGRFKSEFSDMWTNFNDKERRQFSLVWFSLVWFGLAWLGLAWLEVRSL